MNYCTVCKRKYRQNTGYQTGRCPVCGSMLVRLSDDALDFGVAIKKT